MRWVKNSACWLTGIFLSALPAWGQVEIGEDWKFNLNGNLGYAYSGSINDGSSSHGSGLFGNAALSGSFYNPNFVNFSVSPYFGRQQDNNLYGSLGNASGVTAAMNLFSGSHFPVGVTYGRGYNQTSQFGLPSTAVGLEQLGNSQIFGLTWSEVLPNVPTVNVNYAVGDSSNQVIGLPGQDTQDTKTLSVLSTYHIDGFSLAGGFIHRNIDTSFTELLSGGELPANTSNAGNDFHVSASHPMAFSGSCGVAYGRTNYSYDYHDAVTDNTSGASDTLNGSCSFHPFQKFSIGTGASYGDSVLSALPESVASGAVENLSGSGTFRSLIWTTDASYQLLRNLTLHGIVAYEHQEFFGQSYSSTQYGGGVNYNLAHRILGSLSFGLSVFDYANQFGNNGMGFTGNLNFNRKLGGWDLDGNFAYLQNVQTLYVVYNTSGYNWVTDARRRLANRTFFAAGYGGARSGFSGGSGNSNSSERFSGSFIWKEYNLNGYYSKADGVAILTPTGLTPLPGNLPPGLLPASVLELYGAKAVGGNVGGVFMHKLTFSLGYSDGLGTSVSPTLNIRTNTELYNAIFQYRLRKVYLNGGYTRLRQGVGAPGTLPVTAMSYYIGFTRWFDFF